MGFSAEIDGVVKTLPDFEWTYTMGLRCGKEASRVYVDKRFGACRELHTKMRGGEWQNGEFIYYLEDDPRIFKAEQELAEAIMKGPIAIFEFSRVTKDRSTPTPEHER